jgi:hypothetical protein
MGARLLVSAAVVSAIAVFVACGTPELEPFVGPRGSEADAKPVCKRGDHETCTCPNGKASTKTCSSAGQYLECVCEAEKVVCGDLTCSESESCKDCPSDCGKCPVCTAARACSAGVEAPGKLIVAPKLNVKLEAMPKSLILQNLVSAAERGEPGLRTLAHVLSTEPAANPTVEQLRAVFATQPKVADAVRRQLVRPELKTALALGARIAEVQAAPLYTMSSTASLVADGGLDAGGDAGDGGTPVVCDAPKLRVRVSKVTVNDNEDYFSNDTVYCFLTAESLAATDGVQGSHTAPTPTLGKGESHTFSGNEAIFWGVKQATDPKGELTLHYDCWEQDDPTQYIELTKKAAEVLSSAVTDRVGNGWIGSAVSVAMRYLPALVAMDGDDHLFSAAQTIPRSAQLDLAKGATWNVRREGTHLNVHWDWQLRVEAWGCVDNGFTE